MGVNVMELLDLISKYRDRKLAEKLVAYINRLCGEDRFLVMHVCGTQPH